MTELTVVGPRPTISDVAPPQLAAWLAARGEPAYRARQVLTGIHRPEVAGFDDLTDLPLALREALASDFRFSADRRHARDRGRWRADRQGGSRAARRPAGGIGPDANPGTRPQRGAHDDLHLQPGGVRGGLPLLRDRAGRLRPPAHARGDRGPGPALAPDAVAGAGARLAARRAHRPLQHRLHGDGGATRQRRPRLRGGAAAQRPAAARRRRAAHHRLDLRRHPGHRPDGRPSCPRSTWPSACMRRPTRCATSSCRSTTSGRWPS